MTRQEMRLVLKEILRADKHQTETNWGFLLPEEREQLAVIVERKFLRAYRALRKTKP